MMQKLGKFGALAAAVLALSSPLSSVAQSPGEGVTVAQDRETFTLDNGIVRAVVNKRNGDLLSMTYKGVETITPDSAGHSGVYWSHDVTGGCDIVTRISVDPAANGGERAEVSVKGVSCGIKMGHGPGTPTDGDMAVDIDIRFAMGRGEPGIYTYTAFDHPADYPAGSLGEARIAIELARYFDDIHVDAMRTGRYPLFEENADKYMYVTRQADERAFGFTSSTRDIGWFLLNPSAEYLSGGPNKAEFVAHGDPTVLNYWKSSHNGGANVTVAAGEQWSRVVGPFMFYVNEGPTHSVMVADAHAQLRREEAKWPYDWVVADGYAPPSTRSEVTGQLVLDDPTTPGADRYSGPLTVGLTKTPYTIQPPAGGAQREINWQIDGKYLQHWSHNTDPSGGFVIPDVPPGRYNLHAYAAGVIGEYMRADVVIPERGGTVDLGRLVWTPVRYGRTVWEVGTPDRDAREFNSVEQYYLPSIQTRYGELFPSGVNYRIGHSRPESDWFFAHGPQPAPGVTPEIAPFSGLRGNGEATTYKILFDMPDEPRGAATLRLGFTTWSGPGIEVAVNGTPVGVTGGQLSGNAFPRHQIYGLYTENELAFDASVMQAGENVMTLTIPAGAYNNVAVYDYVRLELDERAPPPAPATRLTLPPARPTPASATGAAENPPPPPSPVITVHDDPRFGLPGLVVGETRVFVQAGASGRESLMIQEGQGAARRLVDGDSLSAGGLNVFRLSPDGRYVAYAVAENDRPDSLLTIRVVEAATGHALPDVLVNARYTALAWSPDSRGFYYSRVPIPTPGPMARYQVAQEVYYHRLGDTREEDRRLLASDRGGMMHFAELSDDGRWLVINGSVAANGRSDISLVDLTSAHPNAFKAMRTMRNNWQFAGGRGDKLYFVTDDGAARKRLVALDLSFTLPRVVEIVPERAERLQAARVVGNNVHLSYAAGSGNRVDVIPLPR